MLNEKPQLTQRQHLKQISTAPQRPTRALINQSSISCAIYTYERKGLFPATLKTTRSWGLTLKLSRFLSYKYMHHVKHSPFHVFPRVFHTAFSKAILTHFTHFMLFWDFRVALSKRLRFMADFSTYNKMRWVMSLMWCMSVCHCSGFLSFLLNLCSTLQHKHTMRKHCLACWINWGSKIIWSFFFIFPSFS